MSNTHVLVGFSGGMDSFATAYLLKKEGYEVTAVHLILYEPSPETTTEHLQLFSRSLSVPLRIEDMRDTFQETVIKPFVDSYLTGKTPSPCIGCNESIKLKRLFELSNILHADWIATGHYAKKGFDPKSGRWFIERGLDRKKEQSYFLAFVSQVHLQKLLLPLGSKTKDEIKKMLSDLNLPISETSESHDICFLEGKDYKTFIQRWVHPSMKTEGTFINAKGEVLGTHTGFYQYTIGQRRGIGIADKTPYYVTALHPETNQVEIGKIEELYKSAFSVTGCRWHLPPEEETVSCLCQIRYRHTASPATIQRLGPDRAKVVFAKPQRAITPGQIAAFYQENRLIGAGTIETVLS